MLAKGINVALGMDGHGINDDEDLIQELRLCAALHRTPGLGNVSPTVGQLLKMVTVNGAKVTFFSDQIGTLEKGKRADIILINLERITEPYLDPKVNIADILLGLARASDVDTVMIDGEIVLRNRKHTRINKDEIVAGLRESLSKDLKLSDSQRVRLQLAKELRPYIFEFYKDWQDPNARPYSLYNSA